MRVIKFRAKARFNGTLGSSKWIYSSLMRLDYPTNRLNLHGQDCDIETLGQFTGQLDKNGKEIYEGDKVNYQEDGKTHNAIVSSYYGNNLYFVWQNSQEVPTNTDIFGCKEELEIVGNIHEQ